MRILTCRGLIRCRSFDSNSRFCCFAESKLILNYILFHQNVAIPFCPFPVSRFSSFYFFVSSFCYFVLSFYAIVFCRFLRFSFVVLSNRRSAVLAF